MKKLLLLITLTAGINARAALPPGPILGYWILTSTLTEEFFPPSGLLTTDRDDDTRQ